MCFTCDYCIIFHWTLVNCLHYPRNNIKIVTPRIHVCKNFTVNSIKVTHATEGRKIKLNDLPLKNNSNIESTYIQNIT
jgi:hypothetical protein